MSGGEGFEPERPALGLKDTGLDEPVEGAQKGAEASAPGENPVCDPSGLTIGSTQRTPQGYRPPHPDSVPSWCEDSGPGWVQPRAHSRHA